MNDPILVEWQSDRDASFKPGADITVYEDGAVRLSARFGGGRFRLEDDRMNELRRLIDDQHLAEIESEALQQEVTERADEQSKSDDTNAVFVNVTQSDSATTRLRIGDAENTHEIVYQDLVGDTLRFPEIAKLQSIRQLEIKLLEIASEYGTKTD